MGVDDHLRRSNPHAEDLQGIGSSGFRQDAVSREKGKRGVEVLVRHHPVPTFLLDRVRTEHIEGKKGEGMDLCTIR